MFPELIARSAVVHGDAVAYRTDAGWGVTYADLDRLSDEAAVWLNMRDMGEGSVVGLCLPSRVDYIVALLAVAKVGAITAGIDPAFTESERAAVLEVLQPDLVLADTGHLPDSLDVEKIHLAGSPEEILASERVIGETPEQLAPDLDRPVMVCFVSGGEGGPKGAWFANRQLAAVAALLTVEQGRGGGNRYSSAEFAQMEVMARLPDLLASGTTTHLLDQWRAESVLQLIHNYRISTITTSAAQMATMAHANGAEQYDLGCVDTIVIEAQLSSPPVAVEGRDLFNSHWSIRHSSTESGGLGLARTITPGDEESLNGTGRPVPGVDAEIRDRGGAVVRSGAVGELWLRSEAVMSGYWNDPTATADTLVDGWLRTGVQALADGQGYIRLAAG